MRLHNIKRNIILSFIAITTVPLLCLGIFIFMKGQTLIRENVINNFMNLTETNSLLINRFINERKSDMRLMGKIALDANFNYYTLLNKIKRMQEEYEVYRCIIILDYRGHVLFKSNAHNNLLDRSVINESINSLQRGEEYIYNYNDKTCSNNCIIIGIPLMKNNHSNRYGVLVIIDFSSVTSQINNTNIGMSGIITIIDDKGSIINKNNGKHLIKSRILPNWKLLKQGEFISSEYIDDNGNRCIQGTKKINHNGWILTVQQKSDEILSRVNLYRLYILLFIAVSIAVAFIIGYFAADVLTNMLKKSYDHEKELEMMILQNEKLSSMGVITSGIAHELNNPLANALIYTQMLHEKLKERYPSDDLSSMTIAVEELTRCGAIIKNLMSFSRRSSLELQEVDINDVLKGLLKMTEKYFKENSVSVSVNLQEDLPKALCNESIIHQAIMNMFTNAIEAMKQGGKLKIKTWFTPITNMVKIDIQDSGTGIQKSIIGKIFDPFFSTKPSGERTGLGLYISYEMIRKAGGNIRVVSSAVDDGNESGIHTGTTFTIELPVVRQEG